MKYRIDRDAGAPAYLQLYMQLRRDIVDGLFPLQAKLPSKRTIADDTGISTVTVEHAYALLCDEGYIEARQRSGYFVIFHAESTFLPSTDHELHHPIAEHHHSNINEEFPFSVLVKSMRAVISNYAEAITDKSAR